MSDFAGRGAVVVGGGSGIGAAVARQLAAQGARVTILGPVEDEVRRVAEGIGGVPIVGRGEDPDRSREAVDATLRAAGRLDHLVLCAGIGRFGSVTETDDETWAAVLSANLTSAFVSARAALPALEEHRGSVVVVSSVAGLRGTPHFAAYVTSKHALIGLVRSMAVDYGAAGVRVNGVCPGLVRTPMADSLNRAVMEARNVTLDEVYDEAAGTAPLNRVADPEDIAEVVCFLLSDRARAMTGAIITADGGLSALDPASAALDARS
jgi:meso-butanediol dehydrogenase/(S,S)-butanediol dehydrogenase/diacetyl reductase